MEKHIGFKIIGIRTEQFATIEDNLVGKKKIEVLTDLEYKTNTESNQIGTFVTFTFNAAKKPFIRLQVSCHFQIAEDSWKECVNDTQISFPRDFMIHLAMMTIGTARGILHSKTEGTAFNKFLLPTINVYELVKEDIVFNNIH